MWLRKATGIPIVIRATSLSSPIPVTGYLCLCQTIVMVESFATPTAQALKLKVGQPTNFQK